MNFKNIINLFELNLKSKGIDIDHYNINRSEITSKDLEVKKLSFDVKELLPGQLSCPYHYHHDIEEIFIILKGKALLRQDDKVKEVKEGDLIFFECGPKGVHQLYNNSDSKVLFLDLTTFIGIDICEYPDSNKINSNRNIFIKDTQVTYYTGENKIPSFWHDKYNKKE